MSMGAKASRDRVEGSSVVILLGDGKTEMYSRLVSAQEVMLHHPQHVLIHLDDVLGSDFIVTPETVLLPGQMYFLVPLNTFEWLRGHKSPLHHPNVDIRSRRTCVSATDPTHNDYNLSQRLMDDMSTRPPDPIAASPQRPRAIVEERTRLPDPIVASPLRPQAIVEERTRLPDPIVASPLRPRAIVEHKPSPTFKGERLNPARRRAEVPLSSIRWSENTQRLWRSSPRVCPGEDRGGSEEKYSEDPAFDTLSPLLLSPNRATSTQLKRTTSMQLKLLPNQETPACNLVLPEPRNLAVADRVSTMSLTEVDLLGHRRSQSLQELVQECQTMPLFEFLKCPELNVGKLLEDKPQCQLTFAERVDNEVHEADKQITMDVPVGQTVEVHEHIGALPAEEERSTLSSKAMVSCLQEDVQQKQSHSHVFTKPTSQVDVIDKPHMAQAYHKDEDGECSPLKENFQIQVLGFDTATCDDEGTSGFQQGNEDGGDISESFLPCISVIQDQQEGCAYMPPETPSDLQTSNLALSFNDDGVKKTVEDEVTLLDCQTTCGTQQVVTVNDIFLLRPPNHLGHIDFGVGKGGHDVCGMSGVPSLSSPPSSPSSSLPLSLLSSSSFSSSLSPSSSSAAVASSAVVALLPYNPVLSSSVGVASSSVFPSSSSLPMLVTTASSYSSFSSSPAFSSLTATALLATTASSSSSFPSPSPLSLSSLMGLDRPETMGLGPSQQAKNFTKNQQNLALLGFSPLRSNSPSLFKQAMAHKRASCLTFRNLWDGASSNMSSLVEQQTRQPFAAGPSQPRIHENRLQPRIHENRLQPRIHLYRPQPRIKIGRLIKQACKKPLSPIFEVSPELSPTSPLSPLSTCPS